MIADTAKLAVQLDLTGNLTGGLQKAEAGLTRFSGLSAKASGAMSHFGGVVKNLANVALVSLGVGLVGITGFFEKGIAKAQDFGDEVRQISAITGLAAPAVSALAAAMEHYGVSADTAIRLTGFLEKNVGLLAARKKGIVDFQKQLGLALTDNHGKLLDANALILQTADYFNNKSIPATEKAAALSKLYGRSWQELIPFLKAGRQGIADAEAEAERLGLTLTQDNVDALAKMKAATRDLGTAMGGLELQIGLTLVPTITDLAQALTRFVSDHRSDIVTFFKNAIQTGKDAAKVIGGLASAVGSFWGSIPPGVRDLLTKGLVADRTVKFLFGFSPIEAGVSGIFGHFLERGSSPANPMFVSGIGLGGLPGGAGGGAGFFETVFGGSAISAFGAALALVFAPVAAVALVEALAGPGGYGSPTAASRAALAATGNYGRGARYSSASGVGPISGPAGDRWAQAAHELTQTMDAGDKSWREMHTALVANTAAYNAWKLSWAVGSLTERLKHPLAPHSYVNHLLTKADKIALSSEATAKKITELEAIKKKLDAGNHHQAYYLQRIIDAEKRSLVTNITIPMRFDPGRTIRITTTNRVGGGGSSGSGTYIG